MASDYEEEAVPIATRVVYELLGRRWVWPAVTTTEIHPVRSGQQVISLFGRPVMSVSSVHLEGSTEEILYTLESKFRLRLQQPFRASCIGGSDTRRVAVTYTFGSEPPVGVLRAIEVYASELTKAMAGDSTCRLPQRVTTIARQGVSMTLLDPGEYLEEGKTGLPEVDVMLKVFNSGGARRPARVYGRATPPAERINTTQA